MRQALDIIRARLGSARAIVESLSIFTENAEQLGRLFTDIGTQLDALDGRQVDYVPPFLAPGDSYRDNALTRVLAEMDRQDRKWGPQRKQHPLKWVAILTEECGEVAQAALDQEHGEKKALVVGDDQFLLEAVQVAAVAVQMAAGRLQAHDDARKLGGLAR